MLQYIPGWQEAYLWVVIVGFIVAFTLSFAMGGNDCANSYGTSVGSGVLKLWQAYILATIFETLGAGLLGYKVTDTIRKNIVNVTIYSVYVQETANLTYEVVDTCNVTDFDLINNSTHLFNETILPCAEYTSAPFMLGALGSLGGCALWLLIATMFQLPVSTTHSAVGATVGFSLLLKGGRGINWTTIYKIAISWIASPVLAGFFATLFYAIAKFAILNQENPFEASLKLLPYIFFTSLTCNVFSVSYRGSKYLHLHDIAWYNILLAAVCIGAIVAAIVKYFAVPRLRKSVLRKIPDPMSSSMNSISESCYHSPMGPFTGFRLINRQESSMPLTAMPEDTSSDILDVEGDLEVVAKIHRVDSGIVICRGLSVSNSGCSTLTESKIPGGAELEPGKKWEITDGSIEQIPESGGLRHKFEVFHHPIEEHPHVSRVFYSLQVMSACFMSFSHGSNDTANAIGLLVAIWFTYKDGSAFRGDSSDAELEGLILFGAVGMIVGLWALGHKVIQTVGNDITEITPCSGFCMELGTSFTVLFASKIGIPVSTTHCLVGAVVCVGWFKGRSRVSWKIFHNIAISWLLTLPVTGALSAIITYLLQFTL